MISLVAMINNLCFAVDMPPKRKNAHDIKRLQHLVLGHAGSELFENQLQRSKQEDRQLHLLKYYKGHALRIAESDEEALEKGITATMLMCPVQKDPHKQFAPNVLYRSWKTMRSWIRNHMNPVFLKLLGTGKYCWPTGTTKVEELLAQVRLSLVYYH